jgi:hypothetical protein
VGVGGRLGQVEEGEERPFQGLPERTPREKRGFQDSILSEKTMNATIIIFSPTNTRAKPPEKNGGRGGGWGGGEVASDLGVIRVANDSSRGEESFEETG